MLMYGRGNCRWLWLAGRDRVNLSHCCGVWTSRQLGLDALQQCGHGRAHALRATQTYEGYVDGGFWGC